MSNKKIFCFLMIGMSFNIFSQKNEEINLSVEDCIEIFLQNNLEIIKQNYEIEQANLNNKLAATAFIPKITAEFTTGSSIFKEAKDLINRSFSVKISQFIFNGGRTIKSILQSQKTAETLKISLLLMIQQSAAEITADYFSILLKQKQLKIYEDKLKTISQELKISEKLFELGKITKNTLITARLNLEEAENLVQQGELTLQQDKTILKNRLLLPKNYQINYITQLSAIQNRINIIPEKIENYFKTAIENNIEIIAAEMKLQVLKNSIYNSKSSLLPEVSAECNLSSTAALLPFTSLAYKASLNLNFPLPGMPVTAEVFTGKGFNGENNYGFNISLNFFNNITGVIDLQKLEQQLTFAEKEVTLLRTKVKQSISAVLSQLQHTTRKLELFDKRIKTAATKMNIFKTMYQNGQSTGLDLFRTINDYYELELQKFPIIQQLLQLQLNLRTLTGTYSL